MDYAGVCRNMFTPLQKVRVLDAIDNERASLLAVNGNMSLVPVSAPEADFSIETGSLVCQDQNLPIKVLDKSSCMPNNFLEESDWGEDISFLWTISNGVDEYTYYNQNPQFTLSVPGIYSVTLTVTNAFGSDTKIVENALLVTEVNAAATCIPDSEENGYFAYTVYRVAIGDIDNSTSSVLSGLYEDFRCSQNTVLVPGGTYPIIISARANSDYNELFRVYIDYNNNGSFENAELIFEGFTPAGSLATHTSTTTIPSNAVQDALLTMRVIGEPIEITSDEIQCNEDFFVADVEDYGIYISNALGAKDIATLSAFTLSPNPAQASFTLSGNAAMENIALYNMLGQLVLETNANGSNNATMNISSLAAGTYLVQVTSEGKTSNAKLIKE
jgi:PKD repeat protein